MHCRMISSDVDLREIGLLYYVLNSSDLLGDAFRRGERYCSLINEGVRLRVREGKELALVVTYVGVERWSDRHQIEAWVTFLVRICRRITNRHLLPCRVSFIHRREGGCPEMDAFMGHDVTFGADADEVVFLGNDRTVSSTFRVDVENAIAPLLPHGKARAPEIARRLGVSPRTLVRRLAAEGLTFSTVLDRLRADLARRYLQDGGLSISKIAWMLGYREVSAFTHAYKRWTGWTPRKARALEKRPASPLAFDRGRSS